MSHVESKGRDLAAEVSAFGDAVARYERHRRTLVLQATLGTVDLRLLWLLSDGEPRTLRRIANDLKLEQSTVNRQVNAALQSAIVRRIKAAGEIAHMIVPTVRGTELLEKTLEEIFSAYRNVFERMGADRARALVELFTEFVDTYETENGPDRTP